MLEVWLTNSEKKALISEVDQDLVFLFSFHLHNTGYARTGTSQYLQKIIAARMGIQGEVDHEDRERLNCQRDNLRLATRQENCRNRTAGALKGVSWHSRYEKYISHITVKRKLIHLGYFTDPVEAAKAYDKAAQLYFGEFAVLNFPKEGSNA